DQDTVDQVVQSIGNQIKRRDRVMKLVFRDVAVAPAEELFQHEEDEDAKNDQQRSRERRLVVVERLRQQMDEGIAEQTADGKSDKIERDPLKAFGGKGQRKETDLRDQADDDDADDGIKPDFHVTRVGSGLRRGRNDRNKHRQ